MKPRKRSRVPPWERGNAYPRHPIGRARRRWPRAYDGGEPTHPALNRRYRRAYDGDQRAERRRSGRRRLPTLERLRQSPVRNGLIGLAVAGTAAPLAVNRYQDAMRTDPAHERAVTAASGERGGVDDAAVRAAWESMNAEGVSSEAGSREQVIEENLSKHSEYSLTRQMAEDIYDMAIDADVDPDLAFNLVRAESSFKNTATSRVGATGLTQLMPRTAAWLEPGTSVQDLRDQKTNLRIGFKYLNDLIEKYDGNVDMALTAYNRGPGTVDRALKKGQNPDNGYADFVFGRAGHGHTG